MRILITGGAGYIGSNIVSYLASTMLHEIVVFDNFMWNQKRYVAYPLSMPEVTVYQEDVTKWSDNLKREIEQADVIIPLAAYVGAPLCNKFTAESYELNENWYNKLLPLLNKQLVIYPNTNSSYGSQTEVCTEETPLKPLSLYAQTKDNAEKIVRSYEKSVCFRLATVFGMSYRPRLDLLVNNLTHTAIKTGHLNIFEGHFNRNYIHVNDVVNAFDWARKGYVKPGVYNLGNDAINMTKLELANKIGEMVGVQVKEVEGTDNDKRNYIVSSKKLYDTGYGCLFGLEEGIKEVANFSRLNIDDPCFRNY